MGDIVTFLWKISWQAAVFTAIVWLVCLFARKAPASWRYALWLLVLIKFLIPPFAYLPSNSSVADNQALPAIQNTNILPITEVHLPQHDLHKAAPAGLTTDAAAATPSTEALAIEHPHAIHPPKDMIVFLLWVCGVLAMAAILIARLMRLQRIVHNSREANADLRDLLAENASILAVGRLPGLRLSEQVATPMLVGLFRPMILLPVGIGESCSRKDLSAMFLHELAHIKRRDMAGLWIHQLVQVLFFFHPAVWLAGRELRREREFGCDELVLSRSGVTRQEYAAGYVSALKLANGISDRTPALAMAEPFDMEKMRLYTILSKPLGKLTIGWIIALIVLAGVGLVTFVGVRSRSEDPKEKLTKANMISLAKVLQRYAHDHGGRLPIGVGQDWVLDCKDYIRSVPILFSPYDRHSREVCLRIARESGINANSVRILGELHKRHETMTDYLLTNIASSWQMDDLNPNTILLIDNSSDKHQSPICLRADLKFQKIVAANDLLYKPPMLGHSPRVVSPYAGGRSSKPAVWDEKDSLRFYGLKTESLCIFANPPKWQGDGITATVRGLARVKQASHGHVKDELAVLIEGCVDRTCWYRGTTINVKLVDGSGKTTDDIGAGGSSRSDGPFNHVGLFPLPQKGSRSIRKCSLIVQYETAAKSRSKPAVYPMQALKKPLMLGDGGTILALVDWHMDETPSSYLDFGSSDEFHLLPRPAGRYMTLLVHWSFSSGGKWGPFVRTTVYDPSGRQVVLTPAMNDFPEVENAYPYPMPTARRPYLGMQVHFHVQGTPIGDGLPITAVDRNGPAWTAGIRPGDKLLKIGPVSYPSENGGIVSPTGFVQVGTPVTIMIERNGSWRFVTVAPIDDPLLGNVRNNARIAWNRLVTSNFRCGYSMLSLTCMVSQEPVPAGFRPSKIEFSFPEIEAPTTATVHEATATFQNIPIPEKFWARK